MQPPPLPPNEAARLAALKALGISADSDPKLDRLVRLTARLLDMPIALVGLIDETRQWFKAQTGMEVNEVPRNLSFCTHAIATDQGFEVDDARLDARFHDHPMVTTEPGIRFYAGELVRGPFGHALGTLCVVDTKPRHLSEEDRVLLRDLADLAGQELWFEASLRLKDELQRQESLYRLMVEHLDEGVVLQNRKGILQANARAAEILGLTESQLLGRDSTDPRWQAVHEDGTPWPGESHPSQEALKTGKPIRNAIIGIHRPDGSLVWLQLTAAPVGEEEVLVSFSDITTRRQAAQELKGSEERYRGLVKSLPDLMYRLRRDGTYLDVVAGLALTPIAPPEQMLGRKLHDFLPSVIVEQFMAAMRAVLEFGEPRVLQITYDRGDGEVDFEIRVSCCAPDECLLVIRDVSERTAADRMKREFIATVSHELRTPLSAIRGALGLLEGTTLEQMDADGKEMIDIARRNTERLMRLINDILDLESMETGRFHLNASLQSMALLAEEALEVIRPLALQLEVSLELGSLEDGAIRADGARVVQAISNLLSNAVKFSPKHSSVLLSLIRREGQMRVEVLNEGPGIPPAFRSRIFEKFAQADATNSRAREGTGLGLSITKTLVERMGGRIGFDSEPGATRFFIEFPEIG